MTDHKFERPRLAVDLDHTITDGEGVRPEMVTLLSFLARQYDLLLYTDRAPDNVPDFEGELAVLQEAFTDSERGIIRLQLHTADPLLFRHLGKLREQVRVYLEAEYVEKLAAENISSVALHLMTLQAFLAKYPPALGLSVMLDDLAGHINSGWEKILSIAPELTHMAPIIIDARLQSTESGETESIDEWQERMFFEIAQAFEVIEARLKQPIDETLPLTLRSPELSTYTHFLS